MVNQLSFIVLISSQTARVGALTVGGKPESDSEVLAAIRNKLLRQRSVKGLGFQGWGLSQCRGSSQFRG